MGPRCNHKCPCKRVRERIVAKKRRQWEGRARRDLKMLAGFDDWGDMSINQGMLAATRSWKRREMDSPLEPLEKVWPCR